jgi:membrane associated rhomboid family serine protease
MFRWISDTAKAIWFFLKFAIIVIVGYLLMMGGLWLLRQPVVQNWAQGSEAAFQFWDSLETAVKVVGGLFLATWGLRFLDQFLFGNLFTNRFGFLTGGSFNLLRLFTFPLVHGNYSHLAGNTRPLLIFAFFAVILLPELGLLLPLALFMLLVQGIGVWFFGGKGLQLGASGLVLGLFSFDVLHGVFAGGWKTAVALALALIFGRSVWYTLTSRGTLPNGARISVAGHLWGFLSGIFAAYLISPFGPFATV